MSAPSLASVPGLADHASYMDASEAELAAMLVANGQAHVFSSWREGADEAAKHAFFEQVRGLERGYPGGVTAYCNQARTLLRDSATDANPFEGYTPKVPMGVKLDYESKEFEEMEELGLSLFKDSACVLVAGGLGERLGYSGIKVALPTELSSGTTYLGLYCAEILALQAASNALSGTSIQVPLVIMTSDDTHGRTVDLLVSNGYFGMAEGQVVIVKQEKVAALLDNDAHVASLSPYELDTKPHGHGDVHTLLCASGLASKWAAEGRKYLLFFQDTNALCFTTALACMGFSARERLEVNSVCVPRMAGEAVGAIARLDHSDGSSITCNVEYNQLAPLLMATLGTGDVNDASGYSPFPGNINQLIMSIPEYDAVLQRTKGLVPEFVNPKYSDAAKSKFTKPTRLECMMQDHPRVLLPGARVGFVQLPDWTYSPVKNSVAEGVKKASAGVAPRCASQGELEMYEAACKRLRRLGCDIAAPAPWHITGFSLPRGPAVVLAPNLGPTNASLAPKFPTPQHVHVAAGATLLLSGARLTVEKLSLHGTLIVTACDGAEVVIRNLTVTNAGWDLEPLSAGSTAPEVLQIRGYSLKKSAQLVLDFPVPGKYVIDDTVSA